MHQTFTNIEANLFTPYPLTHDVALNNSFWWIKDKCKSHRSFFYSICCYKLSLFCLVIWFVAIFFSGAFVFLTCIFTRRDNVVQTKFRQYETGVLFPVLRCGENSPLAYRNINNHLRREKVDTWQWWEHSPPTSVAQVRFHWNRTCRLSLLLVLAPRVFFRVHRLSSFLKNQNFQIPHLLYRTCFSCIGHLWAKWNIL